MAHIQLCIARNKRRRSSVNYRGLAKVTSRCRKGFQMRFNPDAHWSNALYKGLSYLQYMDDDNVCNLNRDDAAGFRLDTMTTHNQYSSPVVNGYSPQTTHTDYVNKYASTLQTTSYNFPKCGKHGEL